MQLEFHNLDRRWEHLGVRHPARQRRLLASLAESGQQTPIMVVAVEGQPDRYVVIDGPEHGSRGGFADERGRRIDAGWSLCRPCRGSGLRLDRRRRCPRNWYRWVSFPDWSSLYRMPASPGPVEVVT